MWIDSHCHLNHENIRDAGSVEELISGARDQGVTGMLTINTSIAREFDEILNIARGHDNVWCAIGTHPHEASAQDEIAITKDQLVEKALSDPNVIGIGETGLDYHYDFSAPEDQQASFRKHMQACIETDLPMIVHAREADEDIIRMIKEEGAGTRLTGVMHCFSSGPKMAEEALDLGFYISFSGIVTFKKADELRKIAQNVPLDRILVETDAPYLAPTPHRGKTNVPAYTALTGAFLAEHLGQDAESFARQTTENFFRLFKRAKP